MNDVERMANGCTINRPHHRCHTHYPIPGLPVALALLGPLTQRNSDLGIPASNDCDNGGQNLSTEAQCVGFPFGEALVQGRLGCACDSYRPVSLRLRSGL